jgi:hypothetical protein
VSTHVSNSALFNLIALFSALACNLVPDKAQLDAAYITMSLSFDSVVFALILFYTFKASQSSNPKHLLEILRRDSAFYFFVLFSSQLVWVLCIFYARVSALVHQF